MKSKQVTVIHIITKLELGGAQKVCLSLVNGLNSTGHNALLISGASGMLADTVKDQQQVILLPSFKREISILRFLFEIITLAQLAIIIRRYKKKYPRLLVHTHSTKAGLMGRWAAWLARVRNRVHTVHGYAFHAHQPRIVWGMIYFFELITSFITTHYVCVSAQDVKTGIRFFPGFAKKHSIIRAAVNWQQFYNPAYRAPLFPEQNRFIFGTIACFKRQKNIIDLLKAFAFVHNKNPHTRLEIIGDGHQRPELEAWIAQHNLGAVVTLHGWQKNVVPSMLTWHTFVLSSLWEGLPCALVEARLLKLPVLAYDTGGISDIIHSGDNGILIEQKNWFSLAQAMLAVSLDQQLFTKLQNYPDNLTDFMDSTMIQHHIELYQSLTKNF